MACKAAAAALLPLAPVLLVVGFLPPATSAKSPHTHGFRATLTRVHQYPGSNYSAAARRDARRLASLSNAAAGGARTHTSTSSSRGLLQALVQNGAGAYHMSLSLGTPPLTFPAILDTGSDLTWTQCAPCSACFAQPKPLYDPAGSSTFSRLPCASPQCRALPRAFRGFNATGCVYDYRYTVGFTAGYLAADTLAVGEDASSFANVAFGCSTANGGDMEGASGIVGLCRGALSLASQLGVRRFSYCLRSAAEAGASLILFGSLANVTGGEAQSTPLVTNPAARGSPYYYVNLTGVTVGSVDLPVAGGTFGFTATGAGGVIVDSGTTLTYLAEAGHAMVRQAFLSPMAGLTPVSGARFDFDLCFAAGAVEVPVPRLVLRFEGGAVYAVLRMSYFDAVDERGDVACLLVLPTRGVSVIGNVMQVDLHVLYDLDGGTFFARADCASL